jgi:glycosyltransferase involved in cell wall biosynthesis
LRILIFNWRDVSHPWAGGAESYMHEMARRWVKAGCDVGWVSARFHGGPRVEVIDGVRIHRVGGPRSLYALAAVAYLMRLRGRYDVIVDCENGIPFFTPLYSRKPVVLVVHHVHAEVFRNELPRYQQWLALWLEGWLMPVVYRERPIVTVSASTQADLVAAGYNPERISIVANGVDVRNAAAAPARSETPLLLYLGRLKRYKSVDVLLQAMPHLLARFPDTRLMVVGQGPDRERLERLAWKLGLASSVRFLGYVERSARDRLLASAWVAVYPSAFEGFGVTCLEANAWGTPVVAARVPGLQDAVVDGATGVLVTYGDSEQLGRALLHLMADEALRKKLGEQGHKWAARYSWDTSSELFLEKLMLLTGRPVESRAAKSLSA